MPANYDKTDLFWTSQGDYFLGDDGDLQDTEFDPLRSLVQEIRTRASSDQGDWVVFPDVGANVRDFVGEPNNQQSAEAIKTRLIAALSKHGFINTRDMIIKYVPVTRDTLLFRLTVRVAPTAENASSQYITTNLIYSYSDNNVYHIGI